MVHGCHSPAGSEAPDSTSAPISTMTPIRARANKTLRGPAGAGTLCSEACFEKPDFIYSDTLFVGWLSNNLFDGFRTLCHFDLTVKKESYKSTIILTVVYRK